MGVNRQTSWSWAPARPARPAPARRQWRSSGVASQKSQRGGSPWRLRLVGVRTLCEPSPQPARPASLKVGVGVGTILGPQHRPPRIPYSHWRGLQGSRGVHVVCTKCTRGVLFPKLWCNSLTKLKKLWKIISLFKIISVYCTSLLALNFTVLQHITDSITEYGNITGVKSRLGLTVWLWHTPRRVEEKFVEVTNW